VWVRCRTEPPILQIGIGLDVACECIDFDLKNGVRLDDDGSPKAVQYALDDNRFFHDMIRNGELEIWDCESGKLLGRTDPLLPVNVDVGGTIENLAARRLQLESMLAERTQTSWT